MINCRIFEMGKVKSSCAFIVLKFGMWQVERNVTIDGCDSRLYEMKGKYY